jgi:hypothetical protein
MTEIYECIFARVCSCVLWVQPMTKKNSDTERSLIDVNDIDDQDLLEYMLESARSCVYASAKGISNAENLIRLWMTIKIQ